MPVASRTTVDIPVVANAVVNRSFASPRVESFGAISIGEGVFNSPGHTIVRADSDTRIRIGDATNPQDDILRAPDAVVVTSRDEADAL